MHNTLWSRLAAKSQRMAKDAFQDIHSIEDWNQKRPRRRQEFLRAVGLDPLPERCDPKRTEYGTLKGNGYRACKIGFQILPDCWTSAVIFYPKLVSEIGVSVHNHAILRFPSKERDISPKSQRHDCEICSEDAIKCTLTPITRPSITDIALACGFTSSATFSHAFRAWSQTTPRAFRRTLPANSQLPSRNHERTR